MALIHTTLSANSYEVLADTGAVRDPENLFVTRSRRILFRGTEAQLIAAFPLGAATSPSGGTRMLCAGPGEINLCEGAAADPHWETEVRWLGIHASYKRTLAQDPGNADSDFSYRLLYNWARTETQLPIETKEDDGVTPYMVYADTSMVNNVLNSLGGYQRVNAINFVPMIQVIGVINSEGAFPISPNTPKLKALIALLNSTQKPPDALIQSWDALPAPMLHYCPGFIGPSSHSGKNGAYIPVSLQSHRQLSYGSLHAFTLDLQWQQGKTPG